MKKNMLVGTGVAGAALALALMVGTPAVAATPQGIARCGRAAVECVLGRGKSTCGNGTRGINFVDADGDGVCDNVGTRPNGNGTGTGNGNGTGNGTGVCDGTGNGIGNGAGTGNGVCDGTGNGTSTGNGNAGGRGRHGRR